MRADMAKVIVERPRLGSRGRGKPKGYRRALQRLSDDGLPIREGIKRRCRGGTKSLNEHLGPLRRFLDSQVGRPWDKVFSEICAHINRTSAVQDHVRDHVQDYVVTHVILIDGVPCTGAGGFGYGEPLHRWPRWHRWYVCPRTGILRRVHAPPRRRSTRAQPEAPPRYVRLSKTLQCRLIDGAWHLVTLKPLPLDPGQSANRDVVLDRPVAELCPATARRQYGAAVYAVGKRRLSRREIRQLPIPVDHWR
ncbi:MAG TPA: hypothetical protein VG013_18195 [Gemmataceae bacterium]|jgi:hypothetical protein|nr:hypothetical protein [Gemmataceae bacterium]